MAKSIVIKSTRFKMESEKKHSVLYTPDTTQDPLATGIYISKAAFEGFGGYPDAIQVDIKVAE